MAQANGNTAKSIGETFATSEGPFLEYVKRIGYGSDLWSHRSRDQPDADKGQLLTRVCNGEWRPPGTAYQWLAQDEGTFARIVDVQCDNKVHTWRSITQSQMYNPDKRPASVNPFFGGFNSCPSDVAVRLLLFEQMHSFSEEPQVLESLLFAHVLAIEMDMRFSDVCAMLHRWPLLENVGISLGAMEGPACVPGNLLLYDPAWGNPAIQARSLGLREVEGQMIEHVLIVFCSNAGWSFLEAGHLENVFASARSNCKPSEPHRVPGDRQGDESRSSAIDDFTELVKARLMRSQQAFNGFEKWFWLDIILRLVTHSISQRLLNFDYREDERGSRSPRMTPKDVSPVVYCAQTTLDQIETLFLELGSEPPECSASLRSLRLLLKRAQSLTYKVQVDTDMELARKQMAMNESSIAESRSAIALTVLASVFVPISLASSIFGMNVREINHSGPPISAFAITAIVMLGLSALTWMLWRAGRNVNLVRRHAQNEDIIKWWEYGNGFRGLRAKARVVNEAFRHDGPSGLYRKNDAIRFWLGIRSVESSRKRTDVLA